MLPLIMSWIVLTGVCDNHEQYGFITFLQCETYFIMKIISHMHHKLKLLNFALYRVNVEVTGLYFWRMEFWPPCV